MFLLKFTMICRRRSFYFSQFWSIIVVSVHRSVNKCGVVETWFYPNLEIPKQMVKNCPQDQRLENFCLRARNTYQPRASAQTNLNLLVKLKNNCQGCSSLCDSNPDGMTSTSEVYFSRIYIFYQLRNQVFPDRTLQWAGGVDQGSI